jgi:hypothetical protein
VFESRLDDAGVFNFLQALNECLARNSRLGHTPGFGQTGQLAINDGVESESYHALTIICPVGWRKGKDGAPPGMSCRARAKRSSDELAIAMLFLRFL